MPQPHLWWYCIADLVLVQVPFRLEVDDDDDEGVGVRLLWSKPPLSTAMGSHPSWRWRRWDEGVGVRLLWSKPPHSTAMGSHLGWRWGGGKEAAMKQTSPKHCFGLPPQLEMRMRGWEWGCYEANLPKALLWAPTPGVVTHILRNLALNWLIYGNCQLPPMESYLVHQRITGGPSVLITAGWNKVSYLRLVWYLG